jgi:O-methyltransferase
MSNSLYIDLLKKTLIDYHRLDLGEYRPVLPYTPSWRSNLLYSIAKLMGKKYVVCRKIDFKADERLEGEDWPTSADSMIGLKRMENIEYCVNEIIKNNIPGDLIETGVWRGGAVILMKAMLKDSNINDRIVWVADSFEGLPAPDEKKYKADKGDDHYTHRQLAISLEQVKNNFSKYGLLDDNVKFLKGWFKDTLPVAPINKLALLRLDGDMYESTMDGLVNLYPKLSKGGYIIVDDWGAVEGCKLAVLDYRKKHGITEEIITIDWTGVYWKKEN